MSVNIDFISLINEKSFSKSVNTGVISLSIETERCSKIITCIHGSLLSVDIDFIDICTYRSKDIFCILNAYNTLFLFYTNVSPEASNIQNCFNSQISDNFFCSGNRIHRYFQILS